MGEVHRCDMGHMEFVEQAEKELPQKWQTYITCFVYIRGSFRKIVKRGRKLTVEKFGGASLVLFPHLMQCLQVPRGGGVRFWQEGANSPLCPPK